MNHDYNNRYVNQSDWGQICTNLGFKWQFWIFFLLIGCYFHPGTGGIKFVFFIQHIYRGTSTISTKWYWQVYHRFIRCHPKFNTCNTSFPSNGKRYPPLFVCRVEYYPFSFFYHFCCWKIWGFFLKPFFNRFNLNLIHIRHNFDKKIAVLNLVNADLFLIFLQDGWQVMSIFVCLGTKEIEKL